MCVEASQRISSLAWVVPHRGAKKMWVSCCGSVIYVIDGEDLSCHQQTKGHDDIVVGLRVSHDARWGFPLGRFDSV